MPTRILKPSRAPVAAELLARLAAVPVTVLSDIVRGRNLVDAAIRPLRPFPLGQRMVGRAVTAWCERGDIGASIGAIDAAGAGDVVVIDAAGCGLTAYVGEILCGHARRRGIAGVLVNGAVRDIDTIASWPDMPVFSLGNTARGPLSKERGTVNEPIVFGGVRVDPGDIVVADNDGIVVVPVAEAEDVAARGEAQFAAELAWMEELAGGRTLAEVFAAPQVV